MNKKTWLSLGLIVVGSGFVASLLLRTGHNWGDDFAAYILQAQSIATGTVPEFIQSSTFTIHQSSYRFGPITVPWGFPLLLVPVYALFGMKILAFKALLTTCYLVFLIAFFLLARARCSDTDALLVTGFMAFNLRMLSAQNEVLSDLPFLMWSTLGLWLAERFATSSSASPSRIGFGVLTGLVVFMAAFTRFNGVLLFVALAATQFLWLRRHRQRGGYIVGQLGLGAIPYLVFAICYIAQALLLPNLDPGLKELWRTFGMPSLLINLWYYFTVPAAFLRESMLGGGVLYAILLVFFTVTLLQRRARDLPWVLYGLATLMLYVSFPFTQGSRYVFPILPIFFLLAFQGMKDAAARVGLRLREAAVALVYVFWVVLVVTSLGVSLLAARSNLLAGREDREGPFSPGSTPMFSYIRDATPEDSIIIFRKPRLMRLLTGRDALLTSDCADLIKGDFVVISKEPDYDQIPLDQIQSCKASVSLTMASGQGDFVIYAISPHPPD